MSTDPWGPPSSAGFLSFVRNVVGIDSLVLPDSSQAFTYAYAIATATVSCDLPAPAYTLAIYNLGADRIINMAPDQPGRTYFQDLRRTLGIGVFVPGVVASSSDGGTSASTLNTQAMSRLTLGQLQNLKTPYGREYLALAQSYGPNVWGLS